MLLCTGSIRALAQGTVLPSQYDQDRFFVVPVIAGGEAIRLLTDTGGGILIFEDAASRLKLPISGVTLAGYKGLATKFPTFEAGKEVPIPKSEGDVIPIAPPPVRMSLSWLTQDIDGILGQGWFADRVWTFDYPGHKLTFHGEGKAPSSEKAHRMKMGFRKSEEGRQATRFPRIQVAIAGQALDVLLATGASVAVTADALKSIDDGGPAIRATSLISTSIFDQWKKDHPEWRVVSNAEEGSGEPMILVPELTIAGLPVTQVWFTRRPDNNFSEHFSKWTDKPVVAAIGGNVLKGFRVVLDYPNSIAWLEKP
jgi:hypothetical protein